MWTINPTCTNDTWISPSSFNLTIGVLTNNKSNYQRHIEGDINVISITTSVNSSHRQ